MRTRQNALCPKWHKDDTINRYEAHKANVDKNLKMLKISEPVKTLKV